MSSLWPGSRLLALTLTEPWRTSRLVLRSTFLATLPVGIRNRSVRSGTLPLSSRSPAASASTNPWPWSTLIEPSWRIDGLAPAMMAFRIFSGCAPGNAWRSRAAMPATLGVAKLVPLPMVIPRVVLEKP